MIDAAREFLAALDLAVFNCGTEKKFKSELDNATNGLMLSLPKTARSWGAARKAINLFLRDALYNRYLAETCLLNSIETWLEIPLDSAVARGLKKLGTRGELPFWPGLKKLSPSISSKFQLFAQDIALKRGLARVHLDIYLWLQER